VAITNRNHLWEKGKCGDFGVRSTYFCGSRGSCFIVDHRILLIQAKSGYGKTGLMGRFADQCPIGTLAVRLDLKAAAGLGIAYVFYRIRKVLGC
jgi:hypothetical protein